MNVRTLIWSCGCALIFLAFTSCGSGGGGGGGGMPPDPVADAGQDRTVTIGFRVVLDGSRSRDPGNRPLSHEWIILSKPPGSISELSGASSATASFVPDSAGAYTVQLLVRVDTEPVDSSHSSTVTFTAIPPLPPWDDFNSRVWTAGIQNESDLQFVRSGWISDDGRQVLHITYRPTRKATSNFLLAFTNLFPPEEFSDVTEVMAVIKWETSAPEALLKIEGKNLTQPYIDASEGDLFAINISRVKSAGYHEYRVRPSSTTGDLSRLVLVFDNLLGSDGPHGNSDIYLDSVHFIRGTTESVWETFDNPSRFWFPSGRWVSWAGPEDNPPLELISNFDGFPAKPSGALFLRWDATRGRGDARMESAEIKSEGNTIEAIEAGRPPPGLNEDLAMVDTVSAHIVCTTASPLAVFLGHFVDGTTTIDHGFITAATLVDTPGEPRDMRWNIPWPEGFPADDVDVISFIVQNIQNPGLEAGELRIDNVAFSRSSSP